MMAGGIVGLFLKLRTMVACMLNRKIIQLFTVLLVLGLGACDDKQQENTHTEKPRTINLRFGHDLPESSAQHLAALEFARLVNEKSNGRLEITVYPAQSLGSDLKMIEMAREGKLDIILPPTAKLSTLVPAMQVIDLPFLFHDKQEAYQVLDGPAGNALLQQLKSVGLLGVAFWESGYKQMTLDRPLQNTSDLQGVKFRIMPSEVLRTQYEEWGASSVPIEFSKTRKALADRVVNAQENPIGSIYNMKFHEVQSNLVISNHGYLAQVLVFSRMAMDQLAEDLQEILLTSAVQVTSFQRKEVERLEQGFLEKLRVENIEINKLPEDVREVLQKKSRGVLERHRMHIGSAIIERFLQEIDGVRGYQRDGLVVALDADMAGNSSLSGLAIRRGIEIALDEINAAGGVLGKKLHLLTRDNSMVSARGLDNLEKFSQISNLVAVFSGISSPVALSELDFIHQKKILFLDPWAAATGIIENGRKPNYAFRVSVRDEYAGGFLLSRALQRSDKIGLLLSNNGWGRSNYKAISDAMAGRGMKLTATQWFDWSDDMLSEKISKLFDEGSGVIIYVGNTVEGARLVKDMAGRKKQLPIISHWGVVGADFYALTDGEVENIDFQVLQTFSFIGNQTDKARQLVRSYREKYGVTSAEEIVAPVGTAHAYDLTHLLAMAINKAGSTDMSDIRNAMEELDYYDGLVREYRPPFTRERHDALNVNDFFLARYEGDSLVRVED